MKIFRRILIMIFCLVAAERSFAMELLIINRDNYENYVDRIAEAKNLFENVHAELNFSSAVLASQFGAAVEQLKNDEAKLVVVLQNEKMIGSIFFDYNNDLSMQQARWLGYDETIGRQDVIKAIKVIINNVVMPGCWICCCSSKVVQAKYGWLIEAIVLTDELVCFEINRLGKRLRIFTPDKYDSFAIARVQEGSNLDEVD